jgi:hypothetical protein
MQIRFSVSSIAGGGEIPALVDRRSGAANFFSAGAVRRNPSARYYYAGNEKMNWRQVTRRV